jgi:hypothetical protein
MLGSSEGSGNYGVGRLRQHLYGKKPKSGNAKRYPSKKESRRALIYGHSSVHIRAALLPRIISERYKPTGDVNGDMLSESCGWTWLPHFPDTVCDASGAAISRAVLLSSAPLLPIDFKPSSNCTDLHCNTKCPDSSKQATSMPGARSRTITRSWERTSY